MVLHIDKTLAVKALRAMLPRAQTVLLYGAQFSRLQRHELRQGLQLQLAKAADLTALAQLYPGHLELVCALAAQRWARGEQAWMALDGDRFVHLAWLRDVTQIDFQYEHGSGAILGLAEPGLVIYDCWTPPPERAKGYYVQVLRRLLQQAARPCWIYAMKANRASLAGIEKAGCKLAATISRWHWGAYRGRWCVRFEKGFADQERTL